jgi:uncharacterized protein with HEPN domain
LATKNPPREIIAAARGHIARIQSWVAGMNSDDCAADERTRYACERAFIALGEALNDLAGKVDLNALVPGGPWVDPVRFRHFLAHDYDDRTIPPLLWTRSAMICRNWRQH